MPKYPKVNYIGNKEKIVEWIIEEMPVKKGIVVDLFAGGCSVSYALKVAGYSVIANDVLYADYVIAKALIASKKGKLSENVFKIKISDSAIERVEKKIDFLTECLYYPEEVKELARLIAIAEQLQGEEKYIFLALLRRAMIRKLPYSRMNIPWKQIQLLRDEEYSYKKYKRRRAYHNKTFEDHMLENLTAYNQAVFSGAHCEAYNLDVIEMAEKLKKVDVVYMDPPYPSTMNNYDAFYGLYDRMFDKESEHMDFTDKAMFLENLGRLIEKIKKKTRYIVLSQNTRVKPNPEEIKELLLKFGNVDVKEKKHNYQVTGKKNKNSNKELLFILELSKAI